MNMIQNQRQWYVVHCKPKKERRAAAAINYLLGLTTYLPEIRRRTKSPSQYISFFPNYFFVSADLETASMSRINAVPGVLRLVAFEEMPVPVPDSVIESLQQSVDKLNAAGGFGLHDFQPGEVIRLKSGPLQGLEATFVHSLNPSDRVRILIEFLGSLRETEVDVYMLEHSASHLSYKQERRTRGKGRVIR
jgi:transcriptional antiterminator RfaH